MRRWLVLLAKALCAVGLLVVLYGVGAVCCLFAAMAIPEAMQAKAKSYAVRIPVGTDSLTVREIVGRPPDGRWRATSSDPAVTMLHEWRFGDTKLLVRFDRDRVVFANTHLLRTPPALETAVRFFFWWTPYVFGESD